MVLLKTDAEIAAMREGGLILADVLVAVCQVIKPGITTKQLAELAKRLIAEKDAEPAFLNYGGFPDVICISANDQVVHGIPGSYCIKKGDVVSVDIGIKYKNMITDAARTVLVDSEDTVKRKLLDTTDYALTAGINAVKAGAKTGDIGFAVQKVLESKGLGVVRALVGHGVGRKVHEEPDVPNYGRQNTGITLEAGATIAIEPMSTLGSFEVYTAADGWSIMTKDGSLSAHFEDTVLVTKDGAEILTRR